MGLNVDQKPYKFQNDDMKKIACQRYVLACSGKCANYGAAIVSLGLLSNDVSKFEIKNR